MNEIGPHLLRRIGPQLATEAALAPSALKGGAIDVFWRSHSSNVKPATVGEIYQTP